MEAKADPGMPRRYTVDQRASRGAMKVSIGIGDAASGHGRDIGDQASAVGVTTLRPHGTGANLAACLEIPGCAMALA